jgi:hypothetical protein
MTLPYYYTTTLRARLSNTQIASALRANSVDGLQNLAKLKKEVAWNRTDVRYTPEESDDTWKKYRLVKLADAATGARLFPKCYFKMEDIGAYRLVQLKFRPVLFISIFMTIWSSGVLLATYAFLTLPFKTGKFSDAVGILLMLPFHLAFWFFHKVIFKDGAKESVLLLKRILQAE